MLARCDVRLAGWGGRELRQMLGWEGALCGQASCPMLTASDSGVGNGNGSGRREEGGQSPGRGGDGGGGGGCDGAGTFAGVKCGQRGADAERQLDVRRQNGKWSFGHRRRPSCCEACEPAAGAALRCAAFMLAWRNSRPTSKRIRLSRTRSTLHWTYITAICAPHWAVEHPYTCFNASPVRRELQLCHRASYRCHLRNTTALGPRMSVGANTATVDRTAASSTASQPDSIRQSPSPRHKILCYTNSSLACPAVALLTLSSISSFDPQGRYACTRALCKVDLFAHPPQTMLETRSDCSNNCPLNSVAQPV